MMENLAMVYQEFPWFFTSLVFVLGAMVGSFLNVCIYRIPKEESVVFPASHNAQGDAIAWYDNIPIVSWFVLRGKDRQTGEPFSFRYPLVELLTAALFAVTWLLYSPAVAACFFVFLFCLIASTFIDLDHMIIPDRFSMGGMVLGVVFAFMVPSLHGFAAEPFAGMRSGIVALQGVFISSGLILWIALLTEVVLRKETMGFGDVKLMGCIGAFCGWEGGVCALFGGACLGSVFLLPYLLLRKLWSKPQSSDDEGESSSLVGLAIPFGPLLCLGALIYMLGAHVYVDAYFADFSDLLFGYSST